MTRCKVLLVLSLLVNLLVNGAVRADEPLVLTPVVTTTPLSSYEDAPATPDADDPAIWRNPGNPRQSLVIATAKDAGLLVYDMAGRLVQGLLPPNAPQVLPEDPATPAGVNLMPDAPCVDSDSLNTFGRFNNVDIAYGVRLDSHPQSARVDVAVVSDEDATASASTRSIRALPMARSSTSRHRMCRVSSRRDTSSDRRCSLPKP